MLNFDDFINSCAPLDSGDGPRVFLRKRYYHNGLPETPRVGQLIRSDNTPNYLNVVLEVSGVRFGRPDEAPYDRSTGSVVKGKIDRPFVVIRSVRYAYSSRAKFKLLNGDRSRGIRFWLDPHVRNAWHIVQEFKLTPVSHETEIKRILKSLEGVETRWIPPTPNN